MNSELSSHLDFNNYEDYIPIHQEIISSGRYNFVGCRFPLKLNPKIDYFRSISGVAYVIPWPFFLLIMIVIYQNVCLDV